MKTLEDLFLDSLADMHYAEYELTKALPKMAKAATHDDLRAAFESHLRETEGHVQKVERVFELFGQKPKSKKCPAILGIIKEVDEIASENKKSPTINAALILQGKKPSITKSPRMAVCANGRDSLKTRKPRTCWMKSLRKKKQRTSSSLPSLRKIAMCRHK